MIARNLRMRSTVFQFIFVRFFIKNELLAFHQWFYSSEDLARTLKQSRAGNFQVLHSLFTGVQ